MIDTRVFGATRRCPMVRKFVCAVCALLVCVAVVLADEFKGKVTNVDASKGALKVKGGDKEKGFMVKDAKVSGTATKLADIKVGDEVTVTYTKEGKKVSVSEVKVGK